LLLFLNQIVCSLVTSLLALFRCLTNNSLPRSQEKSFSVDQDSFCVALAGTASCASGLISEVFHGYTGSLACG
jgi:hypothetical protein